jgi:nitroreductase
MQVDGTQSVKATIFQRRSVRAYTTAQVGASTIRELLLAAVQAPTAMHLEPWAFAVVQDTARLKRYSDRGKQMFLESAHGTGSTNAGDPRAQAHLAMLADPAFDIFHGASTLIVVCRKTGDAFSDADCWLAAENLILTATAAGLGTCCIGFAVPVLNAPDVKRELGIPDAGAAVAPIIVGVPGATPPGVSRKEPDILAWLR